MSTARKFELAPDEVYIQEALKDGRATIQEVSMKVLGRPDVAFQARVKHIDMDHVHRLSLIHDQEGRLSPVVIFRAVLGAIVRWILADGFHRHEVYRRKGERAIRAYVVDVPMDSIEHEARLFAAMCNQVTLLTRTPQDVRRAVEMLFADPECWEWANNRIADHCGVGQSTVSRYRQEYSRSSGRSLPGTVIDKNGVRQPRTRDKERPKICERKGCSEGAKNNYIMKHKNKTVYLGTDREEAERKRDEIINLRDLKRKTCTSLNNLRSYLESRDLFFRSSASINPSVYPSISGLCGHHAVLVGLDVDSKQSVPWALGCVQILREIAGKPTDRMIVVCYPEEGRLASIEAARKFGVEFLTPEELVESLKGAEGS